MLRAVGKLGVFSNCHEISKATTLGFENLVLGLEDDFKVSLCWMFGQNMDGVGFVRWNGKALKFGGFMGHVENLKFGMRFGCLGILDMICMKCRPGF